MQQFIQQMVRPSILSMLSNTPMQHFASRSQARYILDAGESPFNSPNNRYPDPFYPELRHELGILRGIIPDCIFPAGGDSQIFDLLLRIFCTPGRDNIVTIHPTRSIYTHLASLNDVECRTCPLDTDFALDADAMLSLCNANTKILFLCSPNSPTGNVLSREAILSLLTTFRGLVVIDEAYIDFSSQPTIIPELQNHHNLVVVHTLSKAWASAALSISVAYARPQLISLMQQVAALCPISTPALSEALAILRRRYDVENWVKQTLDERGKVQRALRQLPFFVRDFPSETNFLLLQVENATHIHQTLLSEGILVEDCSHIKGLTDCLRITIGAPHENSALLGALRKI